MTFLGFADVYNVGKKKVYNRNLNYKRFEEGWFTWKLRNWIFKSDSLRATQLQKLAYFKPENIETVIDANFEHFQNTFIDNWSNIHFKHCKNKSKHCQDICELLKLYNCYYFYIFKCLI
jgi:hypothetical protein